MTALILQGRLDSTRLPQKALLPLGEKPMILRAMEALGTVAADLHILACPEDCLEAFEPLAASAGFVLAVGPKEDVLGRYCVAIRRYQPEWVIRATADNPFVFADAASALLQEGRSLGADYSGYSSLPYGAGVEVVSSAALLRAGAEAVLEPEREHVCPYLYGHGELFLLHRPLAPRPWRRPEIRLTVDTPEDYGRARLLYDALSRFPRETRFSGEGIISVYDGLFPPGNKAGGPGAGR
ncbi:MAG: NTP transferase domain-containing protein [Treponema sp.]|jgi:spore coat polysaccharide biosynthesis protein SpsF|nr:NTP transferase domain-containing protein [Treponema sp.]